jgi:hypothetical protein
MAAVSEEVAIAFAWPRSLRPADIAFVRATYATSYADLLAELRASGPRCRRPQRKASVMWRALRAYERSCVESWKGRHATTCWGCRDNEPNQLAHVDPGGCLHFAAQWPYDD